MLLTYRFVSAVLTAVLIVVSLFPSRLRKVSAVCADKSIVANFVPVIHKLLNAVLPVSVTPVKPSGVS